MGDVNVNQHRLQRKGRVRTEDVEDLGRTVTLGQWCVAAVVMAGSAASAGIGFSSLGEHWGIGVITGLGVDCALASGLVMGRRMRNVGIRTYWGTILQWLTAGMTLCLNSGAAAVKGDYALAAAHAFLPVILVVLCEAGSEAQIKLHRRAAQTAAEEQAEWEAYQEEQRMLYEVEQKRMKDEREADRVFQERISKNRIHSLQLEASENQEARDHATRQAAMSLAMVLNLGAVLSRPRPRPKRASKFASTRVPTAPPSKRPTPVQITDELVAKARQLRVQRDADGESTGRSVLQKEFGLTERTARELARLLDERQLHAVGGR
jgi:hypothetical protein